MKHLAILLLLLVTAPVFAKPEKSSVVSTAVPGPLVALTNLNRISTQEIDGAYHLTLPSQTELKINSIDKNVVDGNLSSLMKRVNDRALWIHTASPFLTSEGSPPTVTTATDHEIPFSQLINIAFNKYLVDKVIDQYMPPSIKKIRTSNLLGF